MLGLARLVHRDRMRMIERRLKAALATEARDELGRRAELVREHLQRDLPIRVDVGRAVDDGHPTAAEDPIDPVAPDCRALRMSISRTLLNRSKTLRRDGRKSQERG